MSRTGVFKSALSLAGAACVLASAGAALAQETSRGRLWEPGGPYYYGGLTREQAAQARADFNERTRSGRYNEQTPDIYLSRHNADALSSVFILGYKYVILDEGVAHEGWVFALARFHQGAEQDLRWAISTECNQIAEVIDALRQLPPIGLNASGPGRAGPIPRQGYEDFEVYSRSVAQFEDGYRSAHQVTISSWEGPVAELVRDGLGAIWPCWQDQVPAPPEGSRWRGRY